MYSSTVPNSRFNKKTDYHIINKVKRSNVPENLHAIPNNSSAKYHHENIKPMTTHPKPPTQPQTRENVRFEHNDKKCDYFLRNIHQEQSRRAYSNNHYTAQSKELYDNLADDYNTLNESEIDSLYSSSAYHDNDDSELESIYDPDEYTRRTLEKMETKFNTITNRYVTKVRSQVGETFSKLKFQPKSKINKHQRGQKQQQKNEGTGDGPKLTSHLKHMSEDETINELLQTKTKCYSKIEEALKVLKQVDQLTEQLYRNHIS